MSRLGWREAAILATYVLVWVPIQFLHVQGQLASRPIAWVPFYLHDAPDEVGYPEIAALREEIEELRLPDGPHPGDRVLRIGEQVSKGADRMTAIRHAYLAANAENRIPLVVERDGETRSVFLPLQRVPNVWSHLVLSLALGTSGVLVLWRGRGRPVARAYALAAGAYSLHFCSFYGALPGHTALALWLVIGTGFVYPPLVLRTAMLFPEAQAPRARWPWAVPWLLSVTGLALYIWILGAPSFGLSGFRPLAACFAATNLALLAIVAWNYWRAEVRARRQMRWALYGLFLGTVPSLLLSTASATEPPLRPFYEVSLILYAAIPIFFFLALVRDNLFDIDRLITRTALFLVFLAVFLGAVFSVVSDVAQAASDVSGVQESALSVALSVAVAAGLLAGGRSLYPHLLDWVAPESQRLARGVRELRRSLGSQEEPGALLRVFGEQISDFLMLESCVLYARTAAGFEPITVRGAAVRFAFDASGPLVETLRDTDAPLRLASPAGRRAELALEPGEREVLRILRAEVILPVRHRADLAAFLCLGEKRSGDIFTSQDLSLLETLADDVSRELSRHQSSSVEREGRELATRIAKLYSCFLSYASRDERFARRLRDDLERHDVLTWFAPESLQIGERWREALDDAIRQAERLLVVLSQASLESDWVRYEVEAGLAREAEEPGRRSFLFPIRIDDAILTAEHGWPASVRASVHIGNFRDWQDDDRYREALDRLLRDLSPPAAPNRDGGVDSFV